MLGLFTLMMTVSFRLYRKSPRANSSELYFWYCICVVFSHESYCCCRVQKHRLVWPSPATSQAKLKEHLGRNAAGTFPSHFDSLGLRNENPPSLLNRTTLGAAYSPAQREIYLASRSYLAPSRLYYLLVSIALCSPHGSLPRKHIVSICVSYSGISALRHFVFLAQNRYPPWLRYRYSPAPRVRHKLYSTVVFSSPSILLPWCICRHYFPLDSWVPILVRRISCLTSTFFSSCLAYCALYYNF